MALRIGQISSGLAQGAALATDASGNILTASSLGPTIPLPANADTSDPATPVSIRYSTDSDRLSFRDPGAALMAPSVQMPIARIYETSSAVSVALGTTVYMTGGIDSLANWWGYEAFFSGSQMTGIRVNRPGVYSATLRVHYRDNAWIGPLSVNAYLYFGSSLYIGANDLMTGDIAADTINNRYTIVTVTVTRPITTVPFDIQAAYNAPTRNFSTPVVLGGSAAHTTLTVVRLG